MALGDYKKWALMEETSWRQKSREIWLREGDKNTKFLHKITNARSGRNLLTLVRVNGMTSTEVDNIKDESFSCSSF